MPSPTSALVPIPTPFRPNARSRKVFAALCAAFLLAVLALSGLFVVAEADHDCDGHDCPVCQEMRACLDNFQLVGSALGGDVLRLPRHPAVAAVSRPPVYRAPATTLRFLSVRFNE